MTGVGRAQSRLLETGPTLSGTIDFKLFCFTLGSNITRLLNTTMMGATIEIVPSSKIDMFPGLSRCQTSEPTSS
jgi:hypothetical protein